VFGESNEETAMKCAAVERAGLTPLLCVGETLQQRDGGDAEHVVLEQLRVGFSQMTQLTSKEVMVAYEPVWAIGTGRNATPEDATAIHSAIRRELQSLCGDRSRATPILYGGSVNAGNAPTLLAAAEVDGLLVGGASLDANSWVTLARS
ncbi:MAG: triose-phosphate isomerase, partial [Gemmatimonadaceae bacterium]